MDGLGGMALASSGARAPGHRAHGPDRGLARHVQHRVPGLGVLRAPNVDVAFDVLGQIATGWGTPSELVTPLLLAVIVLMLPRSGYRSRPSTRRPAASPTRRCCPAAALAAGFFLLDVLGPRRREFIYFQF